MSIRQSKSPDTGRLRRDAKRLLKQFRQSPPYSEQTLAAAARLAKLRSFADLSPTQLLEDPSRVRLKHGLAVIASDHGFQSWAELVRAASTAVRRRSAINTPDIMYEPGISALINRWFASYPEARESLQSQGGYLLPYRSQFYITQRVGIELLGLDPNDPDWKAIGWDWVEPADLEAWNRLHEQRTERLARSVGTAAS